MKSRKPASRSNIQVDSTHEHLDIKDTNDGDSFFFFAIGDWERTFEYFNHHQIQMSEPKLGPDELTPCSLTESKVNS
jgi:hypothetical protein